MMLRMPKNELSTEKISSEAQTLVNDPNKSLSESESHVGQLLNASRTLPKTNKVVVFQTRIKRYDSRTPKSIELLMRKSGRVQKL